LVNRLVADGVVPGVYVAMEECGELNEQEPSVEELAATKQTATTPAGAQTASQRIEM
jgi:hypothetical protein